MIQEILDYLLIKSKFLAMSEEDMIAQIEDEESLDRFCYCIYEILNTDVFFQTSDQLMEKLDYFIYKKRFGRRHSNETIRYFNDMVDKIHYYKKLEEKEKNHLRRVCK